MQKPLSNRRILITRASGQASTLAALLEAEGAQAIQIPTIEILPPSSYAAIDAAIRSIRDFDWLVFSSANAVQCFVRRAEELGLRPLPKRIAVIGLATARAVQVSGLAAQVDLMPSVARAEALAELLTKHAKDAKMLLVRAAAARDVLPDALKSAGALVTIAEAYETIVPRESVDLLWKLFTDASPDAITFTSASTAQNLIAILKAVSLDIPATAVLASIGPITSQAMRGLGLEPTVEAAEATIPALVKALIYQLRA
jgi:uroporphyrinogen-III synthase